MAISSYPSPFDTGLLYTILLHVAFFVNFVKNHFLCMLGAVGIHIPWPQGEEEEEEEQLYVGRTSNSSHTNPYVEEFFRSQMPSIKYISIPPHDRHTTQECIICISEFVLDAQITRLSCGHVFHKMCLMGWFNYYNMTCPLCRNVTMIPRQEEQDDDHQCPM